MQHTGFRHRLMASSMIFGASMLAAASAQSALAQDTTQTAVQEVVVTGSRIPQANLQSASPLTVVTAGELKAEGTVNVENLLNNLPSVVAGQNSTVSNGASGTATVDLRGLGPARTLVLIDGKRLQAGDPGLPVPDLNFIPASLVKRVEVLTGGAATTYGADAVAGVVNFIMKRDLEGVQLDAQYGFDQHSNNNGGVQSLLKSFNNTPVPGDVLETNSYTVSAAFGSSTPDGKGNVTAYATYTNLQPILQQSRDFSACTFTNTTSVKGVVNGAHTCAGSSNNATGRFRPVGQGGPGFTTTPAGTFTPYNSSYSFNYGPYNYYQRDDDRYTLGAFAHDEINKHADVYLDIMALDDHTIAQIAPSGLFQGPTYYIPCNNPFLSTQEAGLLGCGTSYEITTGANAGSIPASIGYRFAAAPRQDDLRHTDYRIVMGSKGDIANGWTYDAFIQYGESIYNENYKNDASIAKIQYALDNCVGAPAGCVPINLFKAGALTQTMLNYVLTPSFKTGSTTEQVAEADIVGDLGKYGVVSPFAKDGVGINIGTDYRRENLVEKVDIENSSGDLSGSGGAVPPAAGSFDVYELYTELKAPLVQDKPWIKSLDFGTAYRYSNYSNVGTTSTYKFTLDYAPTRDGRLRASFNHAVRAPSIDDLYQPTTVSLFTGQDPCANSDNTGKPSATLAACERTGVTAADYGKISNCPATQCSDLNGGNPNLKPETADTKTFGIVYTPSYFRGFALTVDFFDINITNTISSIPPTVALSQCLATGQAQYCSLIHRDPTNGSLLGPNGYVISTNLNTGFEHTKGIDIEATYHLPINTIPFTSLTRLGALDFDFVGTYEDKFIVQPYSGGGEYSCTGLYGVTCNQPRPYWRHKLRATWTTPWKMQISAQWRYIGGVLFDGNSTNALLNAGYQDNIDSKIGSYNYLDLSGNIDLKANLKFYWTINNVFDRNPPILGTEALGGYGNGNTYPGTWDALGRTMSVGLSAKF